MESTPFSIFYDTIPVLGSFAVQFGDHLWYWDHLRAGIICGAVQIQDLSGSWCIKGTGESTLVMDSPVPLMHHDPDRSWPNDPDPDHPKGTHP